MDSSTFKDSAISSEEMIEKSSSWTLGCDNALMSRLSNFSKELEQNSQEINEGCESLSRDVTLLQAKLANVTNQFLMLSNSQFVENRVQEYEESFATSSMSSSAAGDVNYANKIKTKAEKEAELIAKMKEAIQIGVSSQEDYTNSISQNQQSYSTSKLNLPHLIGTSKFFSSRYVGLLDENTAVARHNYESKSIPVQQDDDTSHFMNYNPSSTAQTEVTTTVNRPNSISNSINSVPETRGIPNPSIPHENEVLQPFQPRPEQSFVVPPMMNQVSRQSVASDGMKRYLNDGGPPPPDMIDENSDSDDDFKPSSTGPGRLFADDDDDLFNDSSLFSPKPNENLFFGIENSIAHQPTPIVVAPPSENSDKSRPKNLSGGSSVGLLPESDNISSRSPYPVKPEDSQFANKTKLEDQDIFKPHIESNPRLKIPPGAVSVFGSVPPAEIPRLKNQPNTQTHPVAEEPEANVRSTFASTQQPTANVNISRGGSSIGTNEDHETTSHSSHTSKGMTSSQGSLNEPSARSKPVSGLFDDDSDEDLFTSSKRNSGTQSFKKTSALFDDSLNRSANLSSSKVSSQNIRDSNSSSSLKKSIFDDSDSDDDLFSSANSSSSKTKDKVNSNIFVQTSLNESARKNTSLFGDDSGVDLFGNLHSNVIKSSKSNDPILKMSQDAEINAKVEVDTGITSKNKDIIESANNSDKKMKTDMQISSDLADSISQEEQFKVDGHGGSQNSAKPTEKSSVAASEFLEKNNSKPSVSSDKVCGAVIDSNSKIMSTQSEEYEGKKIDAKLKQDETTQKIDSKNLNKISQIKAQLSSKDTVGNSNEPDSGIGGGSSSNVEENVKSAPPKIGKPKISVKTLALGLNLNPLAMRPGARPPKIGSIDKSESAASSEAETPSEAGTPESPGILTVEVEKTKTITKRISPEKDDTTPSPLLSNLAKGRVRIQVKRRPPSKQLLRSYSKQSDELNEDEEEEKVPKGQSDEKLSVINTVDSKIEGSEETDSLKPPESLKAEKDASPSTEEDDIFPVIPVTGEKSQYMPLDEPKSLALSQDVGSDAIRTKGSSPPEVVENLFGKEEYASEDKVTVDEKTTKTKSFWDDSDSEGELETDHVKTKLSLSDDQPKGHQTKDEQKNSIPEFVKTDVNEVVTPDVNSPIAKDSKENPEEKTNKEDIFEGVGVPQSALMSKNSSSASANENKKSTNQKKLFSDDDPESDDGDIFNSRKIKSVTKSNSINNQSLAVDKKPQSSVKTGKGNSSNNARKSQKGLFDSESDDSDDLFKTAKPKANKSAPQIVPEVDSIVKSKSQETLKPKSRKVVSKQAKQAAAAKSIFSDSSDEDLFAPSKMTKKKSTVG